MSEVSNKINTVDTMDTVDMEKAESLLKDISDFNRLNSVTSLTELIDLLEEQNAFDNIDMENESISEKSDSKDNDNDEDNEDNEELVSDYNYDMSKNNIIEIDDNSDDMDNNIDNNKASDEDDYSDVDNNFSNLTDAEIIHVQSMSKTYSTLLKDFDEETEKACDLDEEILDDVNDRLVLKPISKKFKMIWKLYKKQAECFWTPEKIDFSSDKHDYNNLNKNIQEFIKKILAFFAGADSIVNINIRERFSRIKVKEASVAYAFQEMMENIHSEVYSDMLDNIIEDPVEKLSLINAFKTVESIKDMIGWGEAWIESKRRIGFSIMAFTIFEGLMFSGAFAAIYWLKKQLGDNKLQGLMGSNEFIARDEGMHTNFGCLMYDFVIHRLSPEEAITMMSEAVVIAKKFNKDAIKVRLVGMNGSLMGQYIEYVADRLMVYLGYEKIYGTNIPEAFAFMEEIGILNKNNFFERRTTEYQMAHHGENTADWQFKILDRY